MVSTVPEEPEVGEGCGQGVPAKEYTKARMSVFSTSHT